MHLAKLINSVGLLCDIAGALLIWKYGLPESISRTGEDFFTFVGKDETQIEKAEMYDRRARIGIALLVAGFVFQLISNFA